MRRFCCLLALLFCAAAPAEAQSRKPNIVYILADDLGYGDLSCYGQKKFKTPRIDRMAAEGMRFTRHYSGATVCAPSRCSLMTGYHTGHTVVRGNKEVKPVGQAPMPADTVTIAKLLKKAGYATGAFGKWGLGFPGSSSDPLKMGFDTFYGYNCQRNAHTYYPKWLFHDGEKIALDGKTYSHDLIAEQALKFIRANKDKPFFCYLPVAIPHAAMHAPESYVAPYRKQFPEFENTIGKYAGPKVKNPVAAFAGMMAKLDEDVGRVLDLLKDLGLDDNTLVIFTSDNGPHQEGGHKPDFFDSNGPLHGHKRDLTEGGIRVPFIARWPGRIQAGTETDHRSAFWDFLPTACDLAGVETPQDLDGISYLPTLLGKTAEQKKHDYLYWEFHERGGKRALLQGDWKIVQRQVATPRAGAPLLFNLSSDPGEQNDIAAQHPDKVKALTALMDAARTPNTVFKLFHAERVGAANGR